MNSLITITEASAEAAALASIATYVEDARGSLASNTERAIRADTALFTGWCVSAGLPALPAQPRTLVAFIDAMAATKSPATVRRYVSSIVHMHRAAKLTNPATDTAVKAALKRMHRSNGRVQKQAAPLNRNLVERMLAAAESGLIALRNRALLAVSYDTLARRSELVAFDCADFEVMPGGDGTVTVRRSKTDQEGEGMVRYLAADTVREVVAWLDASGVADGPLFRSVGKGGAIGGELDAGDVARIFKRMALAAGLSPEEAARISGHSSRVGAAQDMVRHGVELPAVMQAGGWRTPEMVSRYTRRLDARRSGAAKLAVLQNRG
jgi:integrase